MLSHPAARVCGGFLLLGLMALSVGCTSSKARGVVKGKVTFSGMPLPTGTITFFGANNLTGSSEIKDGQYAVNDAPVGECRISVTVPKAPPPGGGMALPGAKGSVDPENPGRSITIGPPTAVKIVPIPEKYNSPDTSGLTFKVEKGEHTHDIPLTP
jgi:hypothetical protein